MTASEKPTWAKPCEKCGRQIERFRGQGDISCSCGAWYNAGGQRLRDDWCGNESWRYRRCRRPRGIRAAAPRARGPLMSRQTGPASRRPLQLLGAAAVGLVLVVAFYGPQAWLAGPALAVPVLLHGTLRRRRQARRDMRRVATPTRKDPS